MVFDGGKVHIAAGDALWLTARLHVISDDVDVLTGESTVFSLEDVEDNHWYYFGPAGSNDPEYIPQHIFNCSDDPGIYHYTYYHAGIGGMLTPNENPSVSGDVCIVKGDLDMPYRVPNNPAEDPSEIAAPVIPWSVAPDPGVEVAEGPDAIVAELYNPKNAAQKRTKLLGGGSLSGSFYWNGRFDGNTYCPTNAAFGRIKVTVLDYLYDGSIPRIAAKTLVFDPPVLAIIYPSHRFRTEGGPFCYSDQTTSWTALGPLEVGWNPPGLYSSPAIHWQCSWGTIEAPEGNPTAYTPWSVTPGQKTIVTLTASVNGDIRTRDVEVFGDHLGRDMQNFLSQPAYHPVPWWTHLANCHGTAIHGYNGLGSLNESFSCPWGGGGTKVYDVSDGTDLLAGTTFHRGDILYLDDPWSHSVTVLAAGSGRQVQCWMCNGPQGAFFQTATIQSLLDYGHRRIWWYCKP